jgi:hypothetical protein
VDGFDGDVCVVLVEPVEVPLFPAARATPPPAARIPPLISARIILFVGIAASFRSRESNQPNVRSA